MKFRIIEIENYFYIEQEDNSYGMNTWIPLKTGSNILMFASIEHAESYIDRTYVKSKKNIVKEIEI